MLLISLLSLVLHLNLPLIFCLSPLPSRFSSKLLFHPTILLLTFSIFSYPFASQNVSPFPSHHPFHSPSPSPIPSAVFITPLFLLFTLAVPPTFSFPFHFPPPPCCSTSPCHHPRVHGKVNFTFTKHVFFGAVTFFLSWTDVFPPNLFFFFFSSLK